MKKIALSVIGGSLFVAGYYHVHRQAAFVATKNAQVSSGISAAPAPASPLKNLPVFAFRSDKSLFDSAF